MALSSINCIVGGRAMAAGDWRRADYRVRDFNALVAQRRLSSQHRRWGKT
jgi:hypothetical protein